MSRIGKKPIPVPDGVKVNVAGRAVTVEGKLGKLEYTHRPEISVKVDDDGKAVVCTPQLGRARGSRLPRPDAGADQQHAGRRHARLREEAGNSGRRLPGRDRRATRCNLRVGFANEVHKKIPKGLTVTCPDQTHIVIKGTDKQQVGQFAAEVRAVRKPEPYKGKGIRYDGEQVRRKAGKTAT